MTFIRFNLAKRDKWYKHTHSKEFLGKIFKKSGSKTENEWEEDEQRATIFLLIEISVVGL